MSRAPHLPPGAALFAAVLCPRLALAEDTLDIQALLNETVITTASKSTEREVLPRPATSTILTAEDIRIHGIHSIDEALDFLSLGTVTSNTFRAVDVGARGVHARARPGHHFLLLVDGHAVNDALYGAARFERGAGIPMEIVDHIEVILGPGSVLYGSNAMLGVVNVVTKRARDFDGTHVVAESEILKSWRVAAGAGYEPEDSRREVASSRSSSNITGKTGRRSCSGRKTRASIGPPVSPGASVRTAPTACGAARRRTRITAEVPSGMLSFRFKNLQDPLHASSYKRAAPLNNPFLPVDSDFDDPHNYEQDRSRWVDIKDEEQLSPMLRLTTRLYGDTFDYQRFMNISASAECLAVDVTTCRYRNIGVARWAGAEVQTSWDWLGNGTLVTLLGADGRTRFVSSADDLLDKATGDARRLDGRLLETARRDPRSLPAADLAAGQVVLGQRRRASRLRRALRTSLLAASRAHDPTPGEARRLKAIYSEAFRAPSWRESGVAGRAQLAADDLRPEGVRSVEGVLDQSLGSHHLLFGVFRSWWANLVDAHVLTSQEVIEAQRRGQLDVITGNHVTTQYRNVSSIDNYGFNAGYDGSFGEGHFRYAANVTGAIARRHDPNGGDAPLTVAPQFFGNLRLSYAPGGNLPTFALAGHYLAKRPADRTVASTRPRSRRRSSSSAPRCPVRCRS